MLRVVLISFAAIVLLTGPAQQSVAVAEAGNSTLKTMATNEAGAVTQPLTTGEALKAPADTSSNPPVDGLPPAPAAATPPLVPGDVMVAPVKRVAPKSYADKPPVKDAKAETGAKPATNSAPISTPAAKLSGKIKPKAASAKETSRKKLSRN